MLSYRLMGEARVYYGVARPLGCLVTIGTGMIQNIRLPSSPNKESWNPFRNIMPALETIESLYETLLASESAHLVAQSLVSDENIYYRFNFGVRRGDNWEDRNITLDDYEHMENFADLTEEYLKDDKTQERLTQCATRLKTFDSPSQSQVNTSLPSPTVSVKASSVSGMMELQITETNNISFQIYIPEGSKIINSDTHKQKEKYGLSRRISNFVHRRLSSSVRKQVAA
jgi:hypothetical protein